MSAATNAQVQLQQMKRQLVHQRSHNQELQERLAERDSQYHFLLGEKDQLQQRLNGAREAVQKVDDRVEVRVKHALAEKETYLTELEQENRRLQIKVNELEYTDTQHSERERDLVARIAELNKQLSLDDQFGDKREQSLYNQMREDRDRKAARISELALEVNDLARAMENLKAENRQLRKFGDVPENYFTEVELDRIKATEHEKIEDYKKLVRALQEDNLMLEDERARLKYIIKSLKMNQPYRELIEGLTHEQTEQIKQLIIEMKAGSQEVAVPQTMYKLKKENERLKHELRALNEKGQAVMRTQIEMIFKEKGGMDDTSPALNKLAGDSEEIKRLLLEALQKGFAQAGSSGTQVTLNYGSGRFVPPVPHPTFDGEIAEGKSYKFDQKLPVVDRSGKPPMGDVTKHDVASLQLHLQECLELIKRKDYTLENSHIEISALYKRVQDYLICQDLLYQDFVRGEKERDRQIKDKEEALRTSQQEVYELKKRIEIAEDAQRTLQYDPATMEAKVIETSKMNAIHEINVLRLSRKCQTLEESERLVRQAYNNYDKDMQEKDVHVQNRIYQLKTFQAKATHELKQLHARLRKMVPVSEYQNRGAELDLYKHKNAAMATKCADLHKKVSALSTQVRKNMEAVSKVCELEEIQEQTENELQTIRARLSQRDPQFRWETAVFNKVVETLKQCKVSPHAAFSEFDKDGNGTLNREEFREALARLRINDLSKKDFDGLMRQIDTDGDDCIRYKEFLAKLQRHGVRSQTPEEQIIFLLMEGLKKSSQIKSLSEFFELMDKTNSGKVGREDFQALFDALNLKIAQDRLDQFMDHFWKDKDAAIDYQEFLRIFQRYQVQLDQEGKGSAKKAVTEAALREKKRIYDKIYKSLKAHNKQVKHLFAAADKDGSRTVDYQELRDLLIDGMKLDVSSKDVQDIFNLADIDNSGSISLPEFQVDFEKTISNTIEELVAQEARGQAAESRARGPRQNKNVSAYSEYLEDVGDYSNAERQMEDLRLKLKQREIREKNAMEKLSRYQEQMFFANKEKVTLQEQRDNSMEEKFHMQQEHQEMKEKLTLLQKDFNQRMSKQRSEDLLSANESLQTELVEIRAAMNTYKGLTETLADQTKGLKLMIERHKDENENLLTATRELQSQSFEQQKIGKLYYVVMLSRWQEAASNKKYTMVLTEIKSLRRELLDKEALHSQSEVRLRNVEDAFQKKTQLHEKLKMDIGSKCNAYLPVEKALEFTTTITEISDEKHELEEVYFRMHTEFNQMHQSLDAAQIESQEARLLLDAIKTEKDSELSLRLISMSDRLKDLRLGELKAKREAAEVKEKHNYMSKRLRGRNTEVIELEQKCAEYESKMHRREEEFRTLDDQRMTRFFNPFANKFDPSSGSSMPVDNARAREGDMPSYAQHDSAGESLATGHDPQAKAEINVLEKKNARMEDQLRKALDDVKQNQRQLSMYQQWQSLETQFNPNQEGGGLPNFKATEAQMAKQQALKEDQDREMAEAAYQTIKSLNERIDEKNQLLADKDEQMRTSRKSFADQRNADALKISDLERKLGAAQGQKFSQLHTLAAGYSHEGVGEFGGRFDDMTARELKNQLAESQAALSQLRDDLRQAESDRDESRSRATHLADDLRNLKSNLSDELERARQQGNRQILEQEQKKLAAKDKKIQQLTKTIQDFGDKLLQLQQKVTAKDDQVKTTDLNKVSEVKAYEAKVEELTRIQKHTQTTLRKRNAELDELRGQMADDSKTKTAKDEQRKLAQILAETRAQLADEITQKERSKTMLQEYERQHHIGSEVQTGKQTYFDLSKQNQRLQEQVTILECQKKTVVVYNREKGTFEYIGEPICLSHDKEIDDLQALLQELGKWIEANPRITVGTIFEQTDSHGFGELSQKQFESCLARIGVRLRPRELQLLSAALDTRGIGQLSYRPLLRELSGIPQIQFVHNHVLKVAKAVEHRDLTACQFKKLIDSTSKSSLNLHDFQSGLAQLNSDSFTFTQDEATTLFKHVTKSPDPIGLQVSVKQITELVEKAQNALMIERIRDGVNKTAVTLSELFSKHDTNKDGFLELSQIEDLLLELRVFINPNALLRLKGILDVENKQKVNLAAVKKYFSGEGLGASIAVSTEKKPAQANEVQLSIVKMAARKVLSHVEDLAGKLETREASGDGVLSRDNAQLFLDESKVPDLSTPEIQAMLTYVDSSHKGYINPAIFAQKINSLATETSADVMLRRFSHMTKQGINLQQELAKLDSVGRGTLDKKQFHRAMKQLSLSLTDQEIALLWEAAEAGQLLEIKPFVAKVKQARNLKPPNLKPQQKLTDKTRSVVNQQEGFGKQAGAFENWEVEKKYKVKLEALKQQIEEGKSEVRAAEKQTKHWQETANKVEREKNDLMARLVDVNSKPPRATANEAKTQLQLDQIQELKDQLFQSTSQNERLQHTIQVKFKAEIGQLNQEKEKLEDEKRRWVQEAQSVRNKLEAVIGKPRDMTEQREDANLYEANRIGELEAQLRERERNEESLGDQVFQLEEQLLDLKFEKQSFDLQYSRLQKRITDLEQYKYQSGRLSAVQKTEREEEQATIADHERMTGNTSTKKESDTVKLRSKASKSVSELELLVESLKRVIEKQKVENDQLKQKLERGERFKEKLGSEKAIRQRMEELEVKVQNYEARDVNMYEKEQTVRKLIEANKHLRDDQLREIDRYSLLERKYKDLLIKFNMLNKESLRNKEFLFTQQTGANLGNYENFLEEDRHEMQAKKPSRKQHDSYDRTFDDIS